MKRERVHPGWRLTWDPLGGEGRGSKEMGLEGREGGGGDEYKGREGKGDGREREREKERERGK